MYPTILKVQGTILIVMWDKVFPLDRLHSVCTEYDIPSGYEGYVRSYVPEEESELTVNLPGLTETQVLGLLEHLPEDVAVRLLSEHPAQRVRAALLEKLL